MGTSSLLDAVTAACDEMGYDAPSSLVGNADPDARQFLALANKAGRELIREHAWSVLHTLATFPTVVGQSDYALPADYARLIDDTEWDRSTRWPLIGPVTPQLDRALREGNVVAAGLRRDFRLAGGALRIFPTPAKAGDVLAFEYVSRNWVVKASDGTRTAAFTADQDRTIFDFDLMVKEIAWRWRSSKGFDATVTKFERDAALALLVGADLGGATLDMGDGSACRDWDVAARAAPDFTLGTGSGDNLLID